MCVSNHFVFIYYVLQNIDNTMNLDEKTKKLLVYLTKQHPNASVTVLMKLCYFVDLVNVKSSKKQITDFNYIRYQYGPFDKKIYSYLEDLVFAKEVKENQSFANETHNDFIVFSGPDKEVELTFLKGNETESVKTVLDELAGYGAKALTDIAYKTKPMLKIGATRGGTEGIFEKLELNA